MKYFIIAGEPSGDIHAANIVSKLCLLDNNAIFKGIGGLQLQKADVDICYGLERTSFMGFFEVIKNLRIIRSNFNEAKQAIRSFQPDVVILVDYPGFNLRMAKWCKQQGFKVAYYISPTIWAWHESRVEHVKKYVDTMVCILPFEKAFYEKHHYNKANYVGHPLAETIQNDNNLIEHKKYIALLPGSRKQEISLLLNEMIQVAVKLPNEQFLISGISTLKDLYPVQLPKNVEIIFDKTYEILQKSKAAIVCSGTATLETALFNVPQIVVYKTSWLNYQIGKRVAKVAFISLPNLIENKAMIKELIQQDCTANKIEIELKNIIENNKLTVYAGLREKLGVHNTAMETAQIIFDLVNT